MDRLNPAHARSGLSLRRFAHALGTDASRFSDRSSKIAPSAAFLLRAERIADAISRARESRIPSSIDAVLSIGTAHNNGDDDWTYALSLELRDRLRDILRNSTELAEAWEAQPPDIETHWKALAAAFVSGEFHEAGLPAPKWTQGPRLANEWTLDTPRLSDGQIKEQTLRWLAERNIFIAEKDLVTARWTATDRFSN